MPERTARRLSVLPLLVSGERLRIAIADPSDVVVIDELRMALTCSFELVVADPSAIRAGLDHVYPLHMTSAYVEEARSERKTLGSTIDDRAEGDAESAPAVEEVNRLLRARDRSRCLGHSFRATEEPTSMFVLASTA